MISQKQQQIKTKKIQGNRWNEKNYGIFMKSLQFRYKSLDMKKKYHYFVPGKSNGDPNRKTDIN